jgi:hypothetical protein
MSIAIFHSPTSVLHNHRATAARFSATDFSRRTKRLLALKAKDKLTLQEVQEQPSQEPEQEQEEQLLRARGQHLLDKPAKESSNIEVDSCGRTREPF